MVETTHLGLYYYTTYSRNPRPQITALKTYKYGTPRPRIDAQKRIPIHGYNPFSHFTSTDSDRFISTDRVPWSTMPRGLGRFQIRLLGIFAKRPYWTAQEILDTYPSWIRSQTYRALQGLTTRGHLQMFGKAKPAIWYPMGWPVPFWYDCGQYHENSLAAYKHCNVLDDAGACEFCRTGWPTEDHLKACQKSHQEEA